MGLNETLERLSREREEKEYRDEDGQLNGRVVCLAKRVFFERMLKDINPGMSEGKIDALIDRSVMIAEKLYNKLYR